MSGVIVDTSAWIDFFDGRDVPTLDAALTGGLVVLSPVVVAELVSGAQTPRDRKAIAGLVADFPVHETPLEHWIRVGELRRELKARGISISTPDAHVAQCALDRGAPLLARDRIFPIVARALPLKLVTE